MINRNFSAKNDTFWITNFSRSDVTLYDLGITIKAQRSINLLDSKHYSFTRAQLETSAVSGYLFSKRDKISIRKVPPNEITKKSSKFAVTAEYPLERQIRSAVVPEEVVYEELNLDDSKYAEENAEFAEQDRVERWKNRND